MCFAEEGTFKHTKNKTQISKTKINIICLLDEKGPSKSQITKNQIWKSRIPNFVFLLTIRNLQNIKTNTNIISKTIITNFCVFVEK